MNAYRSVVTLACHCFLMFAIASQCSSRMFTIDYENDRFLKDGEPYQYISGSIHYSRVPFYYWQDRLQKIAAAGLDAIQLYVPWNIHEPQPQVYDFAGQQNLSAFLNEAQTAGLDVLLRAGPYICGEWEYGGLPAWLLGDNVTMVVRSMDKKYISAVDRWMSVLFTYIKPYLYVNGGPIIMVQIENEYGSYRSVDCGHDYMLHLHDIARQHLGNDVVLYTTDGNSIEVLKCGTTNDTYATVDFGPVNDVKSAFAAMRQWNPKGPLVNSECYTGWLDHWEGGHAHGKTKLLISTLEMIRSMGASINLYMFEGGTSFGYMNGADPIFAVCTTSYDYAAPLSEAGDITDMYLAIRNFTSQFKKLPPVPSNTSKSGYGKVIMRRIGTVGQLLHIISTSQPLLSVYPLNMEQSGYYYGFVLYRHTMENDVMTSSLSIPLIRDRGYVLVNDEGRGMVDRTQSTEFNTYAVSGQTLDIIVENQGRINYGAQINDNKKGILSNVTFGGKILTNWAMYSLNFTRLFDYLPNESMLLYSNSVINGPYVPTIYAASFLLETPTANDTFLQMCGWFKGQAFINGFNLGRYWPVAGPQVTLYVPRGVFKPFPSTNHLILVELESSPSSRIPTAIDSVEFVDMPSISAKCFHN